MLEVRKESAARVAVMDFLISLCATSMIVLAFIIQIFP